MSVAAGTSVDRERRVGMTRARHLTWWHGLSSFCWGMVYPYTAIYLAREPDIGTTGVGGYFAAAGIANVAIALILAIGWWRPNRTLLGITGNALSMLGYASLAFVDRTAEAIAAGVVVGAGQGAFLAAIIPTISALIHVDDRRRVFATRYAVLNATLAGGAMVTGLLTLVVPVEQLVGWLFVVTAGGYLPLIVAQFAFRRHVNDRVEVAEDQEGDTGRRAKGWSPKKLLAVCAWLVGFQFVAYLIGFSQLESTAPLAMDRLLDIPLVWVSVMLGVNIGTIVACQRFVTAWLSKFPMAVGLRCALLLWAASYAVLAVSSQGGQTVNVVGIVVFAVVFALGECAYSCSFHPWLTSSVPDRELTRATALANSTMGVGMFAGPILGVLLIGLGSSMLVWGVLALIALLGLVTTRVVTRQMR